LTVLPVPPDGLTAKPPAVETGCRRASLGPRHGGYRSDQYYGGARLCAQHHTREPSHITPTSGGKHCPGDLCRTLVAERGCPQLTPTPFFTLVLLPERTHTTKCDNDSPSCSRPAPRTSACIHGQSVGYPNPPTGTVHRSKPDLNRTVALPSLLHALVEPCSGALTLNYSGSPGIFRSQLRVSKQSAAQHEHTTSDPFAYQIGTTPPRPLPSRREHRRRRWHTRSLTSGGSWLVCHANLRHHATPVSDRGESPDAGPRTYTDQ